MGREKRYRRLVAARSRLRRTLGFRAVGSAAFVRAEQTVPNMC